MIKAILIDVGGTLIEPSPSVGHIYSASAQKFGLTLTPAELNNLFRHAWKRFYIEHSLYEKKDWFDLLDIVFSPYLIKNKNELFEDIYHAFSNASAWSVFPDVYPFLEHMKKIGMPVYVASNWDSRLPQLLETLGLKPYFSGYFISYAIKKAKPDMAFFEHILQALMLKPEELVHIGDDEVNDAQAPKKLAIMPVIIRKNNLGLMDLIKRLDINFRN